MPGLTGEGKRATMRSENTEAARARQELNKNPPSSILGAMINPSQASLTDAIRRKEAGKLEATGYSPYYGTPYEKYMEK